MPVRVVLLDEAVADLADLAESGKQRLFCKKLVEIEKHGAKAGQPLGKGLAGWRKLTVGDRNWRIVFRVDEERGVATVCAIGDRDDEACYHAATRRAKEVANPDAMSLAESMLGVFGSRKARRKASSAPEI
jgi:mRNA interferase RelE/StbE